MPWAPHCQPEQSRLSFSGAAARVRNDGRVPRAQARRAVPPLPRGSPAGPITAGRGGTQPNNSAAGLQ
jgi:hypothetical protein